MKACDALLSISISQKSDHLNHLSNWKLKAIWNHESSQSSTYPSIGWRVGHFWQNSYGLADPFKLNVLHHGYCLDLPMDPLLITAPPPWVYPRKHHQPLGSNRDILLKKRDYMPPGCYSPIFPVLNKRDLKLIYLRLTTLGLLRTSINAHISLFSLNLQDAYLHLPIHPSDRRFLRFQFSGVHYQCAVLHWHWHWHCHWPFSGPVAVYTTHRANTSTLDGHSIWVVHRRLSPEPLGHVYPGSPSGLYQVPTLSTGMGGQWKRFNPVYSRPVPDRQGPPDSAMGQMA